MPWIKFTDNFDWSPPDLKGAQTTAYKKGMRQMVTTPCAEAAIAARKGHRCLPPDREKRRTRRTGRAR